MGKVFSDKGQSYMTGKRSERLTKTGLKILKLRGLIMDFRQTERFSPDDLQGVDFWVYSNRHHELRKVPLQIKSSLLGEDNFRAKFGDSICVFRPSHQSSLIDVAYELYLVLYEWL